MKVVAIHGDGGSARIMRRDMGDPSWVDRYLDWNGQVDAALKLAWGGDIVLVGYSRGGAHIAGLAEHLPNIRAAVIYESPDPGMESVPGNFPALLIWNRRGRGSTYQGSMSDAAWIHSRHPVSRMIGKGRHTKFVFGWPPIGHGWDKSLNPEIESWIERNAR